MVDVSVLIVSYRCRDEVAACLASIPSGATSVSTEVIVVDNDSGDGTTELIRDRFPDVDLVASDENLGFAVAVNLAARRAKGAFLLLLNPDTVVHPGAIDALVAFARSTPRHGIYGGRTVNPDGTTHPGSCWGAPSVWSMFCFATMLSTAFRRSPAPSSGSGSTASTRASSCTGRTSTSRSAPDGPGTVPRSRRIRW